MSRGRHHHAGLGETLRGAAPALGKALVAFCISSMIVLVLVASHG